MITPRWLYVLARSHAEAIRRSADHRRNARAARSLDHRAGRHRRHRDPHRQRAARLRDRQPGARGRGDRGLRRHSRDAVSRGGARSRRRARRRQRRRRSRLGPGARRLRGRTLPRGVRRRPGRAGTAAAGALGSDAGRQVHVGVGADGSRLSEALLVLLGVEDRRPASAAARERRGRSRKSSRCGASASASSRWPTTTSIPSR